MEVNFKLAKQISKGRSYCRRQFKKLLKTYEEDNGLHEQWGQLTKRKCEEYLSNLGIVRSISYQDWYDDFVTDLDDLISILEDTLVDKAFNCRTYDIENLDRAEEILSNWYFFSSFDAKKYDF